MESIIAESALDAVCKPLLKLNTEFTQCIPL